MKDLGIINDLEWANLTLKKDKMNNITCLTVNFKTPELTYDCINTFRNFYPDIQHIIIDNGGCEKSLKLLRKCQGKNIITLVENKENVGHGLALNQGIELITTDYVFLLDSDTKVKKGDFLEKMLDLFQEHENLFAIGWLRKVNDAGIAYRGPVPNTAINYIHPYGCLMDVNKFRELSPFTARGAPATNTMRDAMNKGYIVKDFPISDYIWHKVAGTRGMFGGDIKPDTLEEPGQWIRKKI